MKKTILALCACLPFSALAVEFNSPSGNILCSGDEFEMGSVSCFIQDMTTKQPARPRPRDCEFDWGQVFWVGYRGKGYMGCYSDFPYNHNARVLAYGQSINGNGWTCTSQTTGMRCVNKSGHGFQLSRAKQSLF